QSFDHLIAPAIRGTAVMECPWFLAQSALTSTNLTTLAHFSVSSAMNLPKSTGEPASAMPPSSARRAFNLGSTRPALMSLLSFSTGSAGVFLGTPTPYHWLVS